MSELGKRILGIAGYLFAAMLLVFTAMQTYALLYTVSGSHITATVGLVLFEGGMLYWWSVFRREAAGIMQMAVSGIMFGVSLLMVTAAVSLHLGAISPDFLGTETPARIIVVAVLLNLIAKLIFPLVHPDLWEEINDRAQEGKLIGLAEKIYNTRMDEEASTLASDMAAVRTERARARIYDDFTTRLNRRIPINTANGRDELEVIQLAQPSPNGHKPEK